MNISPRRHRHGSLPPIWEEVATTTGEAAVAQAEANLKAFYQDGRVTNIKGDFQLERTARGQVKHRVEYVGFHVQTEEDDAGTIDLPVRGWERPIVNRGKSQNMVARLVLIKFTRNSLGLDRLQMTFPTMDAQSSVSARTFTDALMFAYQVSIGTAVLRGRH